MLSPRPIVPPYPGCQPDPISKHESFLYLATLSKVYVQLSSWQNSNLSLLHLRPQAAQRFFPNIFPPSPKPKTPPSKVPKPSKTELRYNNICRTHACEAIELGLSTGKKEKTIPYHPCSVYLQYLHLVVSAHVVVCDPIAKLQFFVLMGLGGGVAHYIRTHAFLPTTWLLMMFVHYPPFPQITSFDTYTCVSTNHIPLYIHLV